MTIAFPLHRYTYEEYVWLEEGSPIRHEFLAGEIVAIAGGTPEHAAMAAEVIGQLRDQLRGGNCRVFTSDLGVRVMATGLATYPDASVVCGPTERDPDKKTNVTNPRVLVEVTSNGTEEYDRGQKLQHYMQIPSLQAVVIVSHREPWIEVWSRSGTSSSWESKRSARGEEARIPAIDCALNVSAVFEAAEEPR
ncbi:MAG TPA: Uma2 family endonuclease [Polyangiaceae bacterium]|nr:Uma2 family endonuclease [Polyangiaceae bacterium]